MNYFESNYSGNISNYHNNEITNQNTLFSESEVNANRFNNSNFKDATIHLYPPSLYSSRNIFGTLGTLAQAVKNIAHVKLNHLKINLYTFYPPDLVSLKTAQLKSLNPTGKKASNKCGIIMSELESQDEEIQLTLNNKAIQAYIEFDLFYFGDNFNPPSREDIKHKEQNQKNLLRIAGLIAVYNQRNIINSNDMEDAKYLISFYINETET